LGSSGFPPSMFDDLFSDCSPPTPPVALRPFSTSLKQGPLFSHPIIPADLAPPTVLLTKIFIPNLDRAIPFLYPLLLTISPDTPLGASLLQPIDRCPLLLLLFSVHSEKAILSSFCPPSYLFSDLDNPFPAGYFLSVVVWITVLDLAQFRNPPLLRCQASPPLSLFFFPLPRQVHSWLALFFYLRNFPNSSLRV